MLQSPHFLYLPELGQPGAAERDGLPLDGYELASRLSYFLIGSMPDDELFAAADARQAEDGGPRWPSRPAGCWAAPGRARSIVSFFQQWLEISDIATIDKDSMLFPEFNARAEGGHAATRSTPSSRTSRWTPPPTAGWPPC